MRRDAAVEALKQHAAALRARGATAVYLFGSTARDEAAPDSDIDLFLDYDAHGKFSAFDLAGIKLFLEDVLRRPVDVTTRDGLHPLLREGIEGSAVRVL